MLNNGENFDEELLFQKNLENQKLLHELKKEIEKLEKDIKNIRLINLKIEVIKNLKITLRFIQRIAPYIITASLTAGGFKLLGGGLPFYRDNFRNYLRTMTEVDNLGNVRYEQQYNDFETADNTLYYCSKWHDNEDGFYSRNIEMYKIKELTEEDLINILTKENLDLSDILGEPISKKIETKNNILEEELEEKDYLQAVIYSKSDNDYIVCKETIKDNILMTLLYISATALFECFPFAIRDGGLSKFNYKMCVEDIKDNYPSVDVQELTKKLEIKRSNYDRLIRN